MVQINLRRLNQITVDGGCVDVGQCMGTIELRLVTMNCKVLTLVLSIVGTSL